MSKIKAGIIGGAGYTGGELIRLLLNHPSVEIGFIHSKSYSGKKVYEVHTDLYQETDLNFVEQIDFNVDVIFLCVAHGEATDFLQKHQLNGAIKVIDLSQDFRIKGDHQFVYGLPELQRDKISSADHVANPGCFATCIQLALLPLAKTNNLADEVHVSAITGSTGAGFSPSPTTHFSWRNNNISVYKAFDHQHLKEITQSIRQLAPGYDRNINFIPFRGNFSRGILASVYINWEGSEQEALEMYQKYYQDHPFVHVSPINPDLKQVVNTNKCILHLEKHADKLLIISAIDNLLKGASGQAVQNMNLMFGLDEISGLQLKPVAF
ncbi:MAG: N-acetyl-gamma-glutamyl-phosphate reductase [Bacteroidetes bacterium]|nr:N-acetyl-gamma-glutamyl-phosphate reductase [Bacteroidota bacterium]